MRLSWGALIIVLALSGFSGCAGVQQRGQSSSPMKGLSTDLPGRPGWTTPRFFQWRFASADSRVETTRRVAPETNIWPDRSRNLFSRLLSSTRSAQPAPGAEGSSPSLRDSSAFPGRLTVAEANEAIAKAARPRPEPRKSTRDTLVLTTRGESTPDDRTEGEDSDSPALLTASIPLPELGPGEKADDEPKETKALDETDAPEAAEVFADADADANAPKEAEALAETEATAKPAPNVSSNDPEAVLAQAPPPPTLRPTPKPADPEPKPEPEPEAPKLEPEPQAPKLEPEPETPKLEPEPEAPKPEPEPEAPKLEPEPEAPKLEPEPEPKPEPEPEPADAEVSPPIVPVAPTPEAEPIETVKPAETDAIAAPAVETPSDEHRPAPTYRQAIAPFASTQAARPAPVVAATPQIYFDSPEAAAPAQVMKSKPRWVFWPWKRSRMAAGSRHVEAPAQLPPAQFPDSYDSVAARPLVPCPDHARVVTPTAQQQVILPSPQGVAAAPAGKKSHLRAFGARLHEKLDRLHAWKEKHICRHIQNFKAALKGHKCLSCGGHPAPPPMVRPLASPQANPVLATSQFGLY